jgi:hypothetical protein
MSGISGRRICPSFPAHGRLDQPRALTKLARPAATIQDFCAPARRVRLRSLHPAWSTHPPIESGRVGARLWRRSMTWPVCASAWDHAHLERIARLDQEKRTDLSLQSERPVHLPCRRLTAERCASWIALAFVRPRGACSTWRPRPQGCLSACDGLEDAAAIRQ